MNFEKKILPCLLACFICLKTNAQPNASSCLAQVKRVLSKENQKLKTIFDKGNGWHIKLKTVSEVMNETTHKYQTNIENGEIIAGTHMRYTKGNNVEVFADDHDVFTINADNHTILHTRSNPAYLKIKDDSYLKILQDTIFNLMEVTDCNFTNVDNKKIQTFNIKAKQHGCPYNKIVIQADTTEGRLVKVRIEMNPLFQKAINEVNMTTLEENEVPIDKSSYNLKERFLTTDGKLKPPYAQYELRDPSKIKDRVPHPADRSKKRKSKS